MSASIYAFIVDGSVRHLVASTVLNSWEAEAARYRSFGRDARLVPDTDGTIEAKFVADREATRARLAALAAKHAPATKVTEFGLGDTMQIYLGGGASHCAVTVVHLEGTITRTSEKAVQLTLGSGKAVWIPKSAILERPMRDGVGMMQELAGWFRFDDRTAAVVNRDVSFSSISAN